MTIAIPTVGTLWVRTFTAPGHHSYPLSLAHIVRLDMAGTIGGRGRPLVGAVGRGAGGRSQVVRTLWAGEYPSNYPGSGAIEVGKVYPGDVLDFVVTDAAGIKTDLAGSRTILEHGGDVPPFVDPLAQPVYTEVAEVTAPWWVARYELTTPYDSQLDWDDGWLYVWVVQDG